MPVPSVATKLEVPNKSLVDAKVELHGRIIDEFNLALIDRISADDLARQVGRFVAEHASRERLALNQRELEAFAAEVLDEMVGLGPIEPLLKDPTVTDILVNAHMSVYVERNGQLELTRVRFKDEAHLLRIVNKMVSAVGRRVDESSPMVDARLPDGSRVNVAIRPVAVDGPLVSIRKFAKRPISMDRLVELGALRPLMAEVLKAAVRGRISIIVSGGTGSGKTTMLNALSSYISPRERLITIEDAAELQLQQPHVARLETRPPSVEGRGEIRQRELLKNALRMRPDRIILGECRGEEAFDMLQAMNTGHEGSMTTVHANTPRDALSRIEQMIGMAAASMSLVSIRNQIASGIQLVLQLQRMTDGRRRITSLAEITGMEGDMIQMQEIYSFVREGIDSSNQIVGQFRAAGVRPKFIGELKAQGIDLPAQAFDPRTSL
ncbi:CpaF family protein [Hyphomicrobiales bacterium BP6-180914]|uniref:CpaF family protein n=1 Tax=Lichenifustis flavocetrariae TaxID=2949735 RepID=A0AA42CR03_9HYPH|nr:CpaF family protein [Lichenifustis flavocetrariae]MCW6511945.1 CpaF family protein [Lichenifustis flavocetrariae]